MSSNSTSSYLLLAQKIAESKTFSTSRVYQQLLTYLTEATLRDEAPKETTIAMDVFGKDESFNPSESTLVRVNVYNLRKKLQEYYLTEGKEDAVRLRIPKGSYKVEFAEKQANDTFFSFRWPAPWLSIALLALLLLALVGNYYLWQQREHLRQTYQPIDPNNALWGDILSSPKPVLIVLGDLFVFQEYSDSLGKNRVIRDASINSPSELTEFFDSYPELEKKVGESKYTHLIKNNAYSLKDIIPVLTGARKTFDIQVMSRLTSEDLQNNHIIFVGLFKTLGFLKQYFQTSPLDYSEVPAQQLLLKDEKGQVLHTYMQTGQPDAYHTDYGLVAKFPGPRANFILIFSGFHDTGVLQSVKNMTNPQWLDRIEVQLRHENDSLSCCFEILIRAQGIDRTEFDTEVVHLRSLSEDLNVWQTDNED